MKRSLFLIFGLILNLLVFSHPWKPSHYIIVDTDGGIDDMRAITMLLASPDIRVLAVTVSPGALSREKAYIKIKSLSFLCLGGLATAEFAIKNIPLFRQQVKEIIWSSSGLTDTRGFNYNIDNEASSEVLNGEIPIRTVRGIGQEKLFNETWWVSMNFMRPHLQVQCLPSVA